MNTSKLFRLLKTRCREMLLGIFPADMLPRRLPTRRPLLLVCNTDPSHRAGEHWIVIFLDASGKAEYFDSFGMEPRGVFENFLSRHCERYIRNEEQLQSSISSFCGHYCVFYCLFKRLNYSMKDIVNCFSNDTALNDFVVHKFVCENL